MNGRRAVDAVAAKARVFKALGHPVRLAFVERLAAGPRCVCELVPLVPGRQATTSRHLDVLVRTGILRRHREGVRMMYELAVPCILKAMPCVLEALSRAKRGPSCGGRPASRRTGAGRGRPGGGR
jgi:ArsR family transcriptional regulator